MRLPLRYYPLLPVLRVMMLLLPVLFRHFSHLSQHIILALKLLPSVLILQESLLRLKEL